MYQCKGNGMVRDVFTPQQLLKLSGAMGIGHGKNSFSLIVP
jgi:amidophosphoribosyltransferase